MARCCRSFGANGMAVAAENALEGENLGAKVLMAFAELLRLGLGSMCVVCCVAR